MSTKTTKVTARSNKKIVIPKLNVLSKDKVTIHKKCETYELEYKGYKLMVELNDHKVTLLNICGSQTFIFDTVRNPVTKERWQAIAQLIIEACALI